MKRAKQATQGVDQSIAHAVFALLRNHQTLRSYNLRVAVHERWVYVAGQVDTPSMRRLVAQTAQLVTGVLGVRNRVVVDPAACVLADWALQQAVEAELWWSEDRSFEEVRVSVHRGIVTLSGKVSCWQDRVEAERRSKRGGARIVLNHLALADWG